MSSTPSFNAEQMAAVRSERWHQGGDALLTIEAAREWVSEAGLVLFAPRTQQLPMPAPSLVEATLGRAVSAPTAAESETARGLVARMVAEGSVLPLNLLGGPGDVPDFVVSAQMFGYVFTLRGDKGWKQPPSTSGAVKVSPLALKVYEVLAQGAAMTAAELVGDLGREVTENAILRALVELWGQMRVIPLLQQDGGGTMWELTSRRFTKLVKAGANAGQPTALSALISAYLGQVFAASEDEVETFLSPLAARSRVREVLHGLTAGRQLENVVLEGKTLLYIPGALPEFPEAVAAEPVGGVAEIAAAALGAVAGVVGAIAGAARIRKFDGPRTARPPREDRGERPFRKTGGERGGPRKTFGERKPYQRAAGQSDGRGSGDRERRPFQRDRAERSGAQGPRKSFTRPWDEDRKPRPRPAEGESGGEQRRPFQKEGGAPKREFGGGGKREFGAGRPKREFGAGAKKEFGAGAKRESGAGPKREFGSGPRRAGADRGERGERPFRPRREGGDTREGGKSFRKPREGAAGESRGKPEFRKGPKREFGARPARAGMGGGERGERPVRPRREAEGGERSFRPRPEGEGGARPFRPRREGEGGARPYRPRPEGDRPRGEGRPPFRKREEGTREGGAKRPYRSAEGGERPRPSGERRPGGRPAGKPGFGGKPKFGAKRGAGAPYAGRAGGPSGTRPAPRAGAEGGAKRKFSGKPKPASSRGRDVRAKDMRSKSGGTRGPERGPRPEAEE